GLVQGHTFYRYDENSKRKMNATKVKVRNMRTGKEVESDQKGRFSIKASVGDILRFSGFSFKTRRVPVRTFQNVSVELNYRDYFLGEAVVKEYKPDFKTANVESQKDSVKIEMINVENQHAHIYEYWYYANLVGVEKDGNALKKRDGNDYYEWLEFDVNNSGDILVTYDEILDKIDFTTGKFPTDVIVRISSDYYSKPFDIKISIPESVIKRYRSGRAK
ncbi:MAG: hypothetical protein K2K84_03660, partial [Muribaculaceae bacterium]|nr:hypothetical protein [Muribaculaceae bacterium]